ncbi:MAG: molybdate ABC transporter substrate-binding protein [Anaerovoracaceae bacterium]
MKKFNLVAILLIILALSLTGCGDNGHVAEGDTSEAPTSPTDEKVEVYISAAASLTDALTEIQKEYAKESNTQLIFNFAGSGTLQKQIQEGAPADLFISASEPHMNTLEEAGFIDKESRKDLLKNTLTLIATAEKEDVIKDLTALTSNDVESIAMGTPESVPAGKYAQEVFETLGIWDKIQPKLVLAKDVRQVLDYVDTGNVDCGLVYLSDAKLLETGIIVEDMPADSHTPVVYPAALIKDSAQREAAVKFYEFIQNDFSKAVFQKYGFEVL